MITVLGLDSGINSLGAAALLVNVKEQKPFKLTYADSFDSKYTHVDDNEQTANQGKAKSFLSVYSYILELTDPDVICCEDNFFKLSQSTFKRLIEVVTMMSYHTHMNLPHVPFHLALPRLTKQIVGADADKGDKDLVTKGLKACKFLDLNGFDLDSLNEHAKDGILAALYEAVQLYKSYGWDVTIGNSNAK